MMMMWRKNRKVGWKKKKGFRSFNYLPFIILHQSSQSIVWAKGNVSRFHYISLLFSAISFPTKAS